MKIFENSSTAAPRATQQRSAGRNDGPKKSIKRSRPPKIPMSPEQIRMRAKQLKMQKDGDLPEPAAKVEVSKEAKEAAETKKTGKGNVLGDNNPVGSRVKEKLKQSLGTGSFGFSSKEREVLENILKSKS